MFTQPKTLQILCHAANMGCGMTGSSAGSSSLSSCIHSSKTSRLVTEVCVSACAVQTGKVSLFQPPPLLQPALCTKCPRLSRKPENQINNSALRPHVLASDRFLAWLTPYGMNKLSELEKRIEGHDDAIRSLFEAIRQLMNPSIPEQPPREIGFHVKEDAAPHRTKPKSTYRR